MTGMPARSRASAIPASRLGRAAGLGGMATGIMGSVAASGLREVMSGRRPDWRDLVLTPSNVTRLADQLARMRGAAMKVGQLISMDAGEMLPPELATIMARLRADADHMPPRQLRQVLTRAWGADWHLRFARFDVRPVAAASIGQVHRALTRDGRDLAIKVQYPGVVDSIDSDVTNVGALIRVSGLLPRGFDLAPLLDEARSQLRDEADYARERGQLAAFQDLLRDDPRFVLPEPHEDLSTQSVLAMTFIESEPVETLDHAAQDRRDAVVADLFDLMFAEMFRHGMMQSDPNFANYRHDPASGRIVLLDFGAARPVPAAMADGYRALFRAGMAGDRAALHDAALALGFFGPTNAQRHAAMVTDMLALVFAPLAEGRAFDFADPTLTRRMRDQGMEMAAERDFVHLPPVETLYVQRKFGGLFLLAQRLRARVDLGALLRGYL